MASAASRVNGFGLQKISTTSSSTGDKSWGLLLPPGVLDRTVDTALLDCARLVGVLDGATYALEIAGPVLMILGIDDAGMIGRASELLSFCRC